MKALLHVDIANSSFNWDQSAHFTKVSIKQNIEVRLEQFSKVFLIPFDKIDCYFQHSCNGG